MSTAMRPGLTSRTLAFRTAVFRTAALVVVAAGAALTPAPALAITQQGQQMMRNWAIADRCVAAAQKQFPDYTKDSLVRRDQAVQQCLSNSVLAPRAPQAPGPGGPPQP